MKTVSKRLVDNLFRLTKKFYKTGDSDYLTARRHYSHLLDEIAPELSEVVEAIATLSHYTGTTRAQLYAALEALGYVCPPEVPNEE